MQVIAKPVKRQVRSTESSHIVNTTIRLSHNAVGRVSSVLVSSCFGPDLDKTRHYELNLMIIMMIVMMMMIK